MTEFDDTTDLLRNLLTQRVQAKFEYTHGLLGDGLGRVKVPSRPDFVFVRPDRFSTRTAEIFNKLAVGPDGTPVIVGELPWAPGLTQVIAVDWETYINTADGWGNDFGGVGYHGQGHEWRDGAPGVDTFNVYRRQFGDLKTYPFSSGSTTVNVSSYSFNHLGSMKSWPGSTEFPLANAVPTSTGTARFALVYWSPASGTSGFLGVATGTLGLDAEAEILGRPLTPAGAIPSAYVRLAGGQTSITEFDIWDAREPWQPGIAFGTGNSLIHAGLIPISDTGGFYTGSTVEQALQEVAGGGAARVSKLYDADLVDEITTLDAAGDMTIKSAVNSATALQVQQSDTTNVLVVDTSNARVELAELRALSAAGLSLFEAGGLGIVVEDTTGNIVIPDDIVHSGDADTLISLETDKVVIQAGGVELAAFIEAAQDEVVINDGGGGDVDFRVEGTEDPLFIVDVGFGVLSIGEAPFDNVKLNIGGEIADAADNTFGMYMGSMILAPGNTKDGFFGYFGGGAVNTNGNTVANTYGVYSAPFTKSGGGTITNAYGAYIRRSTSATNNYGAYLQLNVGIETTAPGQALDVNQGSGNMIADGYDSHSLGEYKEEVIDAPPTLAALRLAPPKRWRRPPHVTADELREHAILTHLAEWIEEFGGEVVGGELTGDDYRGDKLRNIQNVELKAVVDAEADRLRAERRALARWQRRYYGMVADEQATIDNLPDVLSRNDADEVTGINLNNYIGMLHRGIIESHQEVVELKNRVRALEQA